MTTTVTSPRSFFIDNILRDDFGRKAVSDEQEGRRSVARGRSGEVQGPGEEVRRLSASSSPFSSFSDDQCSNHSASPPPQASRRQHKRHYSNPSSPSCSSEGGTDSHSTSQTSPSLGGNNLPSLPWPAWVYCTRYSDRPSAGPRSRKTRRQSQQGSDEKRPRTAFTGDQLRRLRAEFDANRYLGEDRRRRLATELRLNESQVKIWFQNKRAKLKKSTGAKNPLAMHLMAQGLYNHAASSLAEDS